MTEVVICSAGAVTALGNLEETFQGLLANRSALASGFLDGSLAKWPTGSVRDIEASPGSDQRQQELVRMALSGLPGIPEDASLLLSTTKGAVDELLEGESNSWPGQPWDLGPWLARMAGLTGPVSTISAACASGTMAVIDAAQRLRQGGQEKVILVFGIDLLSRFVVSGFARLHALAKENCRPFDGDRDGLALGEGAAALLMTTAEEAGSRGWQVLARVRSWGVSCDAGHITAPCREASGLLRALNNCTGGGELEVGAINAHGTGTKFNDAMEMRAFSETWQGKIPFHSVKGAIGHCLGAAGVIEAAIAVKSLAAGKIPPTVGLLEPEGGLSGLDGGAAQELICPSILSCNSGFGGINAAVLFDHPGTISHDR
ncbi:MAG: beta-ketoacyl synthase N-terminal-like domain-containing protein [Thermodesulfobacteriota bacterium]